MQELSNLFNVRFPIVQAPMLGVTTPAMVAAVSNAGALGSLPLGGLSPERAQELIRNTKALTDQPFAVNLFTHVPGPAINKDEITRMQAFLSELCKEYEIPYEHQDATTFRFYYYRDLIQTILQENIPIVSFTFGLPDADVVSALKEKDIVLVGTATSVAEAKVLAQAGIDVITVQGIEAGGHRGTFLTDEPLPQVGLFSLLPQVADEVNRPLLAAGGIYDSRTMMAAFGLGASGVQPGSVFITADESAASAAYKNAVLHARDTSTVLTRAFSGRWARGVQNRFMRLMDQKDLTIPYYTIQNQLMTPIRAHAQKNNITDLIALWAGQSAGKNTKGSTSAIITRLINDLPQAPSIRGAWVQ